MMTQETLFTLIGYLGTVCISLAHLVALSGRVTRSPGMFLWLNLIGGISLCFPTYLAQTLVTHVLNGFWIVIALSGMLDHYTRGLYKLSEIMLKVIGLGAGIVVLAMGIPVLINLEPISAMLMTASMVALLCFMGGYFYISTNLNKDKSIPLYLGICMTGNALYVPILIQDGNWPIFWLQIFCFIAGFVLLILKFLPMNRSLPVKS